MRLHEAVVNVVSVLEAFSQVYLMFLYLAQCQRGYGELRRKRYTPGSNIHFCSLFLSMITLQPKKQRDQCSILAQLVPSTKYDFSKCLTLFAQ